MNNKNQETFTRSDIESSLKKEFPNLKKQEISQAIDIILDSIIDSVALDDKVEIRGFGTFSKKLIRPRTVSYQHLTLQTTHKDQIQSDGVKDLKEQTDN